MKRNLLTVIILFIFISNYAKPQFFADSSVSEYAIELFICADSLNYLSSVKQDSLNNSPNSSLAIDRIARLYYKTFDEDPVGYNKYLEKMHSVWKTHPYVPNSKPAFKIHQLKKKIAQKYGVPFTEIIGTPAFLRCKFIKIFSSGYNSSDPLIQNRFQAQNFIFIIEDVLKGEKFFNQGDTIAVMMISDVENPSPNFIVGKSYLVPLTTYIYLDSNDFNMRFNFLKDEYDVLKMGVPPKVFPIQNEIINNCDYFGFNEMNWNEFKEYFKNKFLIFN